MPDRPTLRDFYLLRSTRSPHPPAAERPVARENGLDEKSHWRGLLHDIAIAGLVSANHGYWGAHWSRAYSGRGRSPGPIEKHEALRLLPRRGGGVQLPEAYIDYFGRTTARCLYTAGGVGGAQHRWYMTSRLVTINDIYSFDPNVTASSTSSPTSWGGTSAAHQGIGLRRVAVAHMWRTMIWPKQLPAVSCVSGPWSRDHLYEVLGVLPGAARTRSGAGTRAGGLLRRR